MTQEERWLAKYNEVKGFMEKNHRNPSRHRLEEHDMLNWLKANRKKVNAGSLKAEREKIRGRFFDLRCQGTGQWHEKSKNQGDRYFDTEEGKKAEV